MGAEGSMTSRRGPGRPVAKSIAGARPAVRHVGMRFSVNVPDFGDFAVPRAVAGLAGAVAGGPPRCSAPHGPTTSTSTPWLRA
ncbi:hypothetical protein SGPA1_40953 [Streptomyces misionensis JCM 4497]